MTGFSFLKHFWWSLGSLISPRSVYGYGGVVVATAQAAGAAGTTGTTGTAAAGAQRTLQLHPAQTAITNHRSMNLKI